MPKAKVQYTVADIPAKMAEDAMLSQSACNASGLIHSLDKVVSELWDICHKENKVGTDWVNRHPILTLYLAQICYLNHDGMVDEEEYSKAYELVSKAAKKSEIVS